MRFHIEAALLDVDGTLVDSTKAVERIRRAWAAAHAVDAERLLPVCHGRRSADVVAMFLPVEQRATAMNRFEEFEHADLDDVVALPGARALLRRLPADR